MKAVHKFAAGLAVAGLAVTAVIAAGPQMPHKVSPLADGATPTGSIAAPGVPFNYSTGFEQADGFLTTGYISNTNGLFPFGCDGNTSCWGHTAAANASLITPTLDTIHPATGTQHIRISWDTTTRTNQPNFNLGVDARFPHTQFVANPPVRPVAANTVSVDMAIDTPNGQSFRIQPQSNNQGFLATSTLFLYTGGIYILEDLCGDSALAFLGTGRAWDTTGAYQNYTVAMDPCINRVTYSYAGLPLTVNGNAGCTGAAAPFPCCTGAGTGTCTSGCVIAGTTLEQFLAFGNNFIGSQLDLDNLVMSSELECPSECGNGIIEAPNEQCEPGLQPTGCGAGHACGAVGTPEECTCGRICTLAEPCELSNGTNGPFVGPFDASFGGIFIYNAPAGVDAVSVELCGSTGIDTNILYFGSCGDVNDPGSANDDCCDPTDAACGSFGNGSDPSASCYNNVGAPNYESCTCHDNPLPDDNCYILQLNGGNSTTATFTIEVNKKATCGGGHLGACCDTNGADTGCSDNVLSGDCVGADKVWTENGKCVDITCECIPLCSAGPAPCGDDGCGGSCGTCGDGDVCNGEETCGSEGQCVAGTPLVCNDGNACNGVESCNPSSGCVPGTPLSCNDGVACNGVESCNPSSGCVNGTPVNCDDGRDCSVDTCNEPDGSCSYDESDCSIPTVSEWGLVVLTLMLLIGAKVYFGRRQAIA